MHLYHNSWKKEYREPFGAAAVSSFCRIAIDVNDSEDAFVYLRVWRDNCGETLLEMQRSEECEEKKYRYSVNLHLPDEPCLIWYYFIIKTENETVYYGNNEAQTGGMGLQCNCEPDSYQITVYKPSITPSWFKSGICYQIFPDRFNRDEKWYDRTCSAISSREKRIIGETDGCQKQFIEEDWNKPAYYVRDEDGNVTAWPFYGGSLKGIEEKLDCIKSYGVTSIYLNPIFEAVSNHRYDTADYMKIDAALGTENEFRDLCKAAEERGISIILDGVFSHTGADSIYFNKYGNYGRDGAYINSESQYRHWYNFDTEEPCGYKSWWGVRDLPEVAEENSSYSEMITGEDGVIKKWLKVGARGWRLDVADELPDNFIRKIRESVKSCGEDKLLLGEVWEDASNKISYDEKREFLFGDELDSTMNYPLRGIILDYINYTVSSGQAASKLMSLKENYPRENYYGALNIMSTHDRARILTEMAAEQDYESAHRKVKIVSALQYALPGVPCIYYGDEIGMMGGTDPCNRNAMSWDNSNLDMAYNYRMLGLIYDEHPVLKDGEIEFLSGSYDSISDDILAFVRYNENEKILVLTNRSYESNYVNLSSLGLPENCYALELLESKEVDINSILELERLTIKLILIRSEHPKSTEISRKAGVICHISSLPGGTMGKPARDFVDWMAYTGFKVWQILPLNPRGTGNCPYNSYAAFAGDPAYINYDELPENNADTLAFYENNKYWLMNYVEYMLQKRYGNNSVPDYADIDEEKAILISEQYVFYRQWNDLRAYANCRGIEIMGDLPIFVAADSADVQGNRSNFLTDGEGNLKVHAGVPADGFSDNGQNWGLALYDWQYLRENNYDWWIKRIRQCAERFDILRLDHFRGFSEYFAIPAGKEPKDGNWHHGPGIDFFNKLNEELEKDGVALDIFAEDLGLLDAGVLNLLKLTAYPGMDIWQFSSEEMLKMDADKASHRAFYTGTHDNKTLCGWIRDNKPELDDNEIKVMALDIISTIFNSSAQLAMVQLQDVFLLGNESRMNVPGIAEGNWKWRIPGINLEESYPDKYQEMTDRFRKLIKNANR